MNCIVCSGDIDPADKPITMIDKPVHWSCITGIAWLEDLLRTVGRRRQIVLTDEQWGALSLSGFCFTLGAMEGIAETALSSAMRRSGQRPS